MDTLLFLNIAGLGTPELIILLMVFMLGLIPLVLIVICLLDIVRRDFKDNTTKLIWVLIVLFVPIIGSILYLAIGRRQKVLTI